MAARRSVEAGDLLGAFHFLERAHVLGQRDFLRHVQVHIRMLGVARRRRDAREMLGQLARLALVPIGHAIGRLPRGNTGGTSVNAFQPMPVPPELERLLLDDPNLANSRDGPQSR